MLDMQCNYIIDTSKDSKFREDIISIKDTINNDCEIIEGCKLFLSLLI